MKTLLTLLTFVGLSGLALADIHDPPMNDFGPTRKLGRGLANTLFGASELFVVPNQINDREGNSAAWSYGAVRAVGRFFFRFGVGIYEVATFPIPTYRESYRPPYKLNPPWIHGGFEEFPPELGFETKYSYVREYDNGY